MMKEMLGLLTPAALLHQNNIDDRVLSNSAEASSENKPTN